MGKQQKTSEGLEDGGPARTMHFSAAQRTCSFPEHRILPSCGTNAGIKRAHANQACCVLLDSSIRAEISDHLKKNGNFRTQDTRSPCEMKKVKIHTEPEDATRLYPSRDSQWADCTQTRLQLLTMEEQTRGMGMLAQNGNN